MEFGTQKILCMPDPNANYLNWGIKVRSVSEVLCICGQVFLTRMEFVHARTRCLGTDGLKCTDLSENIHTDLVLRVWGIRPVVKVVGSVNKCSIFDYTKSGIGDSQIWQKVASSLMKKLWSALSTICKCTLKRPKWVHQEKKFIISSGWVHQGLDNVVHCKSRFAI